MPVGEFTELLVTFVNQNSTTGAATGVSVQFQVMDPLNGAAVNFGATVALTPVNSGGVTIGLTSTTLTGFGGWIRAAITTTTATLNGNLFINFQGK
jgi:hypothetical protein